MWWIAAALAAVPVERVEIELRCGSIRVEADPELRVEPAGVRVEHGRTTRIDPEGQGCTDLVVRLPADAALSVETTSASLDVRGLHGAIDFESVSGMLDVASGAHQPSRVRAETVSGDLQIHLASGGEARLESVSGRVLVHGGPVTRVEASTVSGRVVLAVATNASSALRAESHAGEVLVQLDHKPGRARASSFSGRIANAITDDRPSGGHIGTELRIDADRGPSLELETFSGAIRIEPLPKKATGDAP